MKTVFATHVLIDWCIPIWPVGVCLLVGYFVLLEGGGCFAFLVCAAAVKE